VSGVEVDGGSRAGLGAGDQLFAPESPAGERTDTQQHHCDGKGGHRDQGVGEVGHAARPFMTCEMESNSVAAAPCADIVISPLVEKAIRAPSRGPVLAPKSGGCMSG
jgi:hypothetical protein